MTKRNFISFARHLIARRELFCEGRLEVMADWLASEFPRFKRQRWLDFIAGKCGENGGNITPPTRP